MPEFDIRSCRSVLVDICVMMGREKVISEDVAFLPKMAGPAPGINQSVQERSPQPSPVCVETYSLPKSVAENEEENENQTGMSAENLYSSVSPLEDVDQAVIPPSSTWSAKQSLNEKKGQGPDSFETNSPCPSETCKGGKPPVVKILAHQFDVNESPLNNESYPNMKIDSFNAKIQEVQVLDDSKELKSNFADVESLSGPKDEL